MTARSPVRVVLPVTPKVPPTVLLPVKVEVPSIIRLPLAEISPVAEIVTPLEAPYPPAMVSAPELEVRSVALVDERVVKAPVDGVVKPIAVLLIPVEVVLKLLVVMVRSFAPVLMLEAPKPDRVRAPEVAVRFKAPVVWVSPLEAVKVPAEVIAPEPVVEILPEVESTPFSLIVSLGEPPDWISSKVLVAPALVSLITTAVAVP